MRIALTGGIACGKSLVAKFLNELGVETIDADDIVHELIPDPAERKRIAAEVFGDVEKRRELEARLHPLVKERIEKWLTTVPSASSRLALTRTDGPAPVGETPTVRCGDDNMARVAIIPLLFETHWDADYDIICCIRSARATQVDRMVTARGYTRDEAEARLAAQMPVEEKAAKSHYVIENNGSKEELHTAVEDFVVWLNQTIKQSEQSNNS